MIVTWRKLSRLAGERPTVIARGRAWTSRGRTTSARTSAPLRHAAASSTGWATDLCSAWLNSVASLGANSAEQRSATFVNGPAWPVRAP